MSSEDRVYFQTSQKIALLESAVKNHDKEIHEIKETRKSHEKDSQEFKKNLYLKIDSMKDEIHTMALSNQSMAIANQRWMMGILIGFVGQTIVGVFLFVIQKGGQYVVN